MIVTLEKLSVIYAQAQNNMLVVMKEVPFKNILRTAVISIMIYFIKHYLVSTQSKVTWK